MFDGPAVCYFLQSAGPRERLAALAHLPSRDVGTGGERDVFCRDVNPHPQPRAHAPLAVTAGLLAWGTYQALYVAPAEATMGDAQRIFYYHVPAATAASLLFWVNF